MAPAAETTYFTETVTFWIILICILVLLFCCCLIIILFFLRKKPKEEPKVEQERVPFEAYEFGDQVEYYSTAQGLWLQGQINSYGLPPNGAGTLPSYTVALPSAQQECVELSNLRFPFEEGRKVSVLDETAGKWIPAIIESYEKHPSPLAYAVRIEGGSNAGTLRVPAHKVRPLFQEGDKVDVYLNVTQGWMQGTVCYDEEHLQKLWPEVAVEFQSSKDEIAVYALKVQYYQVQHARFEAYQRGEQVEYYSATEGVWVQGKIDSRGQPSSGAASMPSYTVALTSRQQEECVELSNLRTPLEKGHKVNVLDETAGGWIPAVIERCEKDPSPLAYAVRSIGEQSQQTLLAPAHKVRPLFQEGNKVDVYFGLTRGWETGATVCYNETWPQVAVELEAVKNQVVVDFFKVQHYQVRHARSSVPPIVSGLSREI